MQVKGKIDILMILETEIDESVPKGNFSIEGLNLSRAFLLSLSYKILINCSYNPHKSEIKKYLTSKKFFRFTLLKI